MHLGWDFGVLMLVVCLFVLSDCCHRFSMNSTMYHRIVIDRCVSKIITINKHRLNGPDVQDEV